jgi:uncharacterized protein (DUF1499 family)
MNLTVKLFLLISFTLMINGCGNNIHDIPSEMQLPKNSLEKCPDSPNCFRTTQYLEADSSFIFSAIQSVIKEMSVLEIEINDNSHIHTLDVVFKIPVFGWLDDVKIVVEPSKDNLQHTFVHLRSSSREGYFDLGVNKRRINKILKKTRQKLNTQ